jgi:hypothetical protein
MKSIRVIGAIRGRLLYSNLWVAADGPLRVISW